MATWCPLCDRKFKTDVECSEHMKSCSYPKDARKKRK